MMAEFARGLVWIRRDLRLTDHRALAEATKRCDEVAVVFVFDTTILEKLEDSDDRRITFIHESLRELDQSLKEFGAGLIVRHGTPEQEIPEVAGTLKVDAVFVNHDYEPAAIQRDLRVRKALETSGRRVFSFKDQVIFERREVLNGSEQPFKVFTPYKNAWLKKIKPPDVEEWKPDLKKILSAKKTATLVAPWDLPSLGFVKNDLWLEPGALAGKKRIKAFMVHAESYGKERDFPAIEGTSGLSVHLRFGTVSIRECVREAMKSKSIGHQTWLSELIWRDFYQMILDQYPHVVNHAFREVYDKIRWPGSDAHFQKWCDGMTGFPIIDAAMRHFNQTGWMHNRLRMVVASFLTKDLLVDWRLGEKYFARKLLDFDLAANNGGWQWSASTGCDAQPYFRIFNPASQSLRFDPKGEYILRHCPELACLARADIHEPHLAKPLLLNGLVLGRDYPFPIVDHSESREKALALFKSQQA
ncbi:MAG: DNA photolyase family protein [Bdellovibrionales bacterium]|nr:DNA photolyase family protein [Bdellovibrionales bacterium]